MVHACGVAGEGTEVVFETHSWTEDNERQRSTGWRPGRLSAKGRELASELGGRRRADQLDAVLVSDLRRAVETAEIAFGGTDIPVLLDWRLRECDFGDLNGEPSDVVHRAVASVFEPYPRGESWAEAITRVGGVLADVERRWPGQRVLIIGHMSAYWALQHYVHELRLQDVGKRFSWQEGWEYTLRAATRRSPTEAAVQS